MKIKSVLIHLLCFLLFLSAFLWSCEELEKDSMKLTNDTSQMTYYQAMTVEIFHLIDPNPIIPLENNNHKKRIIPSGKMTTLSKEDIMGYSSKDDVVYFFYEVVGDTAYMSGVLELTHKQLRKLRFHVVIDDEELTTRYE